MGFSLFVFNKNHRILFLISLLFIGMIFVCVGDASAGDQYKVDPRKSSIQTSIKYAVLGRYQANVKDFSGTIQFDSQSVEKSSVYFQILTKSLESNHASLDRVACSSRLLDVARYPKATFKSKTIKKSSNPNVLFITGDLTLHGVTQRISFPFSFEGPYNQGQKSILKAHGLWEIDRKEFNIVWHETWDKGGIVVGDQIMLEWEVEAVK